MSRRVSDRSEGGEERFGIDLKKRLSETLLMYDNRTAV